MKKSRRILLTPLEKYLQCNIEEATQISEHISATFLYYDFKNALKKEFIFLGAKQYRLISIDTKSIQSSGFHKILKL